MSMFLTDDDYKHIDDIVIESHGKIDENPKSQLFYADIFKSAIDSGEEFAIDLFHHFNFDLIRENVLVYIVSKYDEENPIQFIKIAELANETQSSDFIISMFKECIFIFEELLKSENIEVLPPVFSVLTKVFQNCPECSVILGEVISITEIDEILFNQLKNNEELRVLIIIPSRLQERRILNDTETSKDKQAHEISYEHQFIENYEDFDVVNRHIDFDKVNKILDKERQKVDHYLQEIVQEVEEKKWK